MRERATYILASLALASGVEARQGSGTDGPWDVISREFTVYVESDDARRDAISREFTVFTGEAENGPRDVISREFTVRIPTADLVTTSIAVPPLATIGETFTVDWTVSNLGGAPADGTWTDHLYLSTDDQIGSDTLLGSFSTAITDFGVGMSIERSQTFGVPGTQGQYWVIVQTVSTDIVEDEVMNNVTVDDLPMNVVQVPLPNLTVTNVVAPTGTLVSSGLAQISFRVENPGPGSTSTPFWTDRVYLTTNTVLGDADDILLASLSNLSALDVGSNYERLAVDYALPEDFAGSYFVGIRTDATFAVAEANEGDNDTFSAAPFTVQLEAQPNLVPTVLTPLVSCVDPVPCGSTGKPFTVEWIVENTGDGPTDSGSWVDHVYLSTNNDTSNLSGDHFLGSRVAAGVLNPPMGGMPEAQQRDLTAVLPLDLVDEFGTGTFWIKVVTDVTNVVSEFGGSLEDDNVAVSSEPVFILQSPTPDVLPCSIALTSPAAGSALAGHLVTLDWSVRDAACLGTPCDGGSPEAGGCQDLEVGISWNDKVWLSENDAVLDVGDVLLGTYGQSAVHDGSSLVGTEYDKTRTVRIPDDTTAGTYHLIVFVDEEGDLPELGLGAEDNNVVASDAFQIAVQQSDLELAVGAAAGLTEPPPMSVAGMSIPLEWRVTNGGPATTPVSAWVDRVWLSDDTTVGGGDALVRSVTHSPALGAGMSYEVRTTGVVPYRAPGSYFLLFEANANGAIDPLFDPVADNLVAVPLEIVAGAADLEVTGVVPSPTVTAGGALAVQWTVANVGDQPTNVSSWVDRVFLSLDSTLGGDTHIGSRTRVGALAASDSYTENALFPIPIDFPAGTYWVIVETGAGASVFELTTTNNTLARRMRIQLDAADPADLVVENVLADATVLSGQPLHVEWDVRNAGAGDTDRSSWTDEVYLSLDGTLDPGTDPRIGFVEHPDFLLAGETRSMMADLVVPSGLSGPFVVFVRTDPFAQVYEAGATANNLSNAPGLTQVNLPPPADLSLVQVTASSSVMIGDDIQVSWDLVNIGANATPATWSDSFYLSADGLSANGTIDGGDILLPAGTDANPTPVSGVLAINEMRSETRSFRVPGVLPGNYFVIGRTDAFNQVAESNESNNFAVSPMISVSVPALSVSMGGEVDLDTAPLPVGKSGYYCIAAPAGLTLRVSLTHASAGAWTELYVREGAIPSPGAFDFRFRAPAASSQEILIPETTGQPYYVLARATAFVGALLEEAEVKVEALPFELLSVQPATVGAGVVTLELSGSQLSEIPAGQPANVRLIPAGGGAAVAAAEIVIEDAANLLAAFDLTGVALGPYDVEVEALDTTTSLLPSAVTVEVAMPMELELEFELSPSIRKGRTGLAFGRVTNPGNVNVAAGILVVGTEANQGATSDDERVLLTSGLMDFDGLETNGTRDSLLLFVRDLGPSQEHEVVFEVRVGDTFPPDRFGLGLSGRAWSQSEFESGLVADVAERLRLAVLADDDAGAALSSLAANAASWSSALAAGLPADATDISLSDAVPLDGCTFVRALADAITAGLSATNQVSDGTLDGVCGDLFEAPFEDGSLDPEELFPESFDLTLDHDSLIVVRGANVPFGALSAVTPTSDDPNKKTSSTGVNTQNQVSANEPIQYRVFFENQPEAAAAASRVVVLDDLDPLLAPETFRLSTIQFGTTTIEPPPGSVSFQTQVEATVMIGGEPTELLVNVFAGIDVSASGNRAVWVLQGIDPETGEPPSIGDLGILPPNDEEGSGEGFVSFSSQPNTQEPLVGTGGSVSNEGQNIFDTNTPIPTNRVSNVLDAEAPTSVLMEVTGAQAPAESTTLEFTWSADDDEGGAGVDDFSLFVSTDGGPFVPLRTDTRDTSASFQGDLGHSYAFHVRARDLTGNREAAPLTPQVEITFQDDCNANGVGDLVDAAEQDCNANGLPDDCDIADGVELDCNGNGYPDSCEVAEGKPDCDGDGIPDDCEADVDQDGLPDDCGPGTYFCFADGGDLQGCGSCPCGNDGAAGALAGCQNSAGQFAQLLASGSPSLGLDTLHFELTGGAPNTFGVLLSGVNALPAAGPCPPGSGIQSGVLDGLRCIGGGLVRHGARATDSNGDIGLVTNGWGPPNNPVKGLLSTAEFQVGQVRHFQVFYRDDAALSCMTGQNTSNGVRVTVGP